MAEKKQHSPRCGECDNCKHVAATQKIVMAETNDAANKRLAVDQSTAALWNDTLRDNPCVHSIGDD